MKAKEFLASWQISTIRVWLTFLAGAGDGAAATSAPGARATSSQPILSMVSFARPARATSDSASAVTFSPNLVSVYRAKARTAFLDTSDMYPSSQWLR